MTLLGVGGPSSSSVVFSIAFTQASQEASGGTTITYNCGSSCSFGASDPNRVIAVYIAARMITVNTISSVTIGGNAASLVTGSIAQTGGTNGVNSAVYYYALGSGATSGNVVVTYGAAAARTCISIYRVVTSTPTPATGAQNTVSNGTSIAQTLSKPAGGGGLDGMYLNGASAGVSWTNASVDYNGTGGTSSQCSSANMTASNPSVSWTTAQAGASSAATWNP